MREIVIAGAGPGGLIAAIGLARAGKDVLLLDPADFDRPKVGECVPGAIARLLAKLNLPPIDSGEFCHREIGGVISLWGGSLRREDSIANPEGGGWRLDRREFEARLNSFAMDAGAIRKPLQVRRVARKGRRWQIETNCGKTLAADFVIDATGRNAVLARQLDAKRIFGPPLVAVWGIGRAPVKTGSNRTLLEAVSDGWWYGAYLPDNRPLAIFHTSPALAVELRQAPDRWLEKFRKTQQISQQISAESFNQVTLQGSDARSGHLDASCGPGWAACGDAALSFDPLSSQGIFNAMSTGHMIASAILGERREIALEEYQESLKQIREINERRRRSLYETAAIHFKEPFWAAQVGADAAEQ